MKGSVDYTGSINCMRFDMVVNAVYLAVASAVSALLADAGVDTHNIDEIIYVGGTSCLPIRFSGGFREELKHSFHMDGCGGRYWHTALLI
jgi:heat shock protein 1/8